MMLRQRVQHTSTGGWLHPVRVWLLEAHRETEGQGAGCLLAQELWTGNRTAGSTSGTQTGTQHADGTPLASPTGVR